jgi:transcriptional regulator with XRE-family HTH domain
LKERKLQLSKPYPTEILTLADALRKRRIDLGLTLPEAALRFGVAMVTFAHWESGRFQPPVTRQQQITSFLGYDPFAPVA